MVDAESGPDHDVAEQLSQGFGSLSEPSLAGSVSLNRAFQQLLEQLEDAGEDLPGWLESIELVPGLLAVLMGIATFEVARRGIRDHRGSQMLTTVWDGPTPIEA